jgi:hypothetical protein
MRDGTWRQGRTLAANVRTIVSTLMNAGRYSVAEVLQDVTGSGASARLRPIDLPDFLALDIKPRESLIPSFPKKALRCFTRRVAPERHMLASASRTPYPPAPSFCAGRLLSRAALDLIERAL